MRFYGAITTKLEDDHVKKCWLRVFSDFKRPDPALVEGFAKIPTSNISDMMNRLYNSNGTLRPYNNTPLLGTASRQSATRDNLMFHIALDLAQPATSLSSTAAAA
jgi:hypothetical protein